MSCSDTTEDQDAYVAAGVDEILTKPVFADKIKRVVGIALERKKARTTSLGAESNHRLVEGNPPT
jgi:CheY-like chemotaxis protein